MIEREGIVHIDAYIFKDGTLIPFRVGITEPERANDEERSEFKTCYCIVEVPCLLRQPKKIYGADEQGSIENTYIFLKALLQDTELLNDRGEPVEVPWSDVELSREMDDCARNNIGMVACLVDRGDGTLRLVFDDAESDSTTFPQQWKSTCLFTWLDLETEKVMADDITDKQYEVIGWNVVARLVAFTKSR